MKSRILSNLFTTGVWAAYLCAPLSADQPTHSPEKPELQEKVVEIKQIDKLSRAPTLKLPEALEIGVRPARQDPLRTLHEQPPQLAITRLRDRELRTLISRLALFRLQAKEATRLATPLEATRVIDLEDVRERRHFH